MPVPRRPLTRRQFAELPYVDDGRPFRRLAAAVLLKGCTDAAEGDECAWEWVQSEQARAWAELAGLVTWPPRREQFANRGELAERARVAPTVSDDDGTMGEIRSRNPADAGDVWVWDGRDDEETRAVLPVLARWEAVGV